MKVAIIPARGGSKRIPLKNVKKFCGKPVIAYSIEAAIQSGCFDKIIVSTDDERVAEVACQFGAEVPFLRPQKISDDFTGTIPVINHSIKWLIENNKKPQEVCCIYSTAPFIRAEDVCRGLELLNEVNCNYVFPVTCYPFPIQRALKINSRRKIVMFYPEHENTRSQDLAEAYHDAGQFYWAYVETWLSGTNIFSRNSMPIILPRYRVQDIDTIEDWETAERMYEAIQNSSSK